MPVPTNRGHSLPLRSFPWATEPKTQNNKVILIRAAFRSDQLRPRQPLQGRHASSELRTNRDQAPTSARKGPVTKPRLPITIEVLRNLKQVWLTPPVTFDDKMLWAAACTGFFGFLRAGELTVPSSQAYDPDVHLSLGDLAIDSHDSPSLIRLTIKQSKTDPFRQGVDIYIGSTNGPVCPVKALIEYLWVRPSTQGALFLFESGAPLTRASLVARLQQALQRAGLNPSDFNGHSFRIGAATTAAQKGLEDSLIQTLGRWKSAAYKIYIKLPRSQIAAVSQTLTSNT